MIDPSVAGTEGPEGAAQPGYRSAAYAAAMATSGQPRSLGRTGGLILSRPIRDCCRVDLAGPYPIFCCGDWSALGTALASPLPGDPVALTIVVDPFCPLDRTELAPMFDVCRPFNDHWVIDLGRPLAPSGHHRRKLRKAGPARIEAAPADPESGAEFARLYRTLIARHDIRDLRAFDEASLTRQLAVPGAHLVTAWKDSEAGSRLIGATIYYLDGPHVYLHLSAFDPEGYDRSISYPMIVAAADYFSGCARYLDLGGAPTADLGGGLARFKRGWTTLTRPSHLCGKVLDPAAYAVLAGPVETGYFPAYREGEFSGADKPRNR